MAAVFAVVLGVASYPTLRSRLACLMAQPHKLERASERPPASSGQSPSAAMRPPLCAHTSNSNIIRLVRVTVLNRFPPAHKEKP